MSVMRTQPIMIREAVKIVAIVAALFLLMILYWVAFTFEDRK